MDRGCGYLESTDGIVSLCYTHVKSQNFEGVSVDLQVIFGAFAYPGKATAKVISKYQLKVRSSLKYDRKTG